MKTAIKIGLVVGGSGKSLGSFLQAWDVDLAFYLDVDKEIAENSFDRNLKTVVLARGQTTGTVAVKLAQESPEWQALGLQIESIQGDLSDGLAQLPPLGNYVWKTHSNKAALWSRAYDTGKTIAGTNPRRWDLITVAGGGGGTGGGLGRDAMNELAAFIASKSNAVINCVLVRIGGGGYNGCGEYITTNSALTRIADMHWLSSKPIAPNVTTRLIMLNGPMDGTNKQQRSQHHNLILNALLAKQVMTEMGLVTVNQGVVGQGGFGVEIADDNSGGVFGRAIKIWSSLSTMPPLNVEACAAAELLNHTRQLMSEAHTSMTVAIRLTYTPSTVRATDADQIRTAIARKQLPPTWFELWADRKHKATVVLDWRHGENEYQTLAALLNQSTSRSSVEWKLQRDLVWNLIEKAKADRVTSSAERGRLELALNRAKKAAMEKGNSAANPKPWTDVGKEVQQCLALVNAYNTATENFVKAQARENALKEFEQALTEMLEMLNGNLAKIQAWLDTTARAEGFIPGLLSRIDLEDSFAELLACVLSDNRPRFLALLVNAIKTLSVRGLATIMKMDASSSIEAITAKLAAGLELECPPVVDNDDNAPMTTFLVLPPLELDVRDGIQAQLIAMNVNWTVLCSTSVTRHLGVVMFRKVSSHEIGDMFSREDLSAIEALNTNTKKARFVIPGAATMKDLEDRLTEIGA